MLSLFSGVQTVGTVKIFKFSWDNIIGDTIKGGSFEIKLKAGTKIINGPLGKVIDCSAGEAEIKTMDNDCLGNIMKCSNGMFMSNSIKINVLREGAVYMSNGGHDDTHYGWAIMYKLNTVVVIVRIEKREYFLTMDSVRLNAWFKLDISFKVDIGLTVWMDNVKVGTTLGTKRISTTTLTRSTRIFFGRGAFGTINFFNQFDREILIQLKLVESG